MGKIKLTSQVSWNQWGRDIFYTQTFTVELCGADREAWVLPLGASSCRVGSLTGGKGSQLAMLKELKKHRQVEVRKKIPNLILDLERWISYRGQKMPILLLPILADMRMDCMNFTCGILVSNLQGVWTRLPLRFITNYLYFISFLWKSFTNKFCSKKQLAIVLF